MADVALPNGSTLRADYRASATGQPTFVFFNPLSGSLDMWEASIASALRDQGFGTLGWNYPGQDASPLALDETLTAASLTGNASDLMNAVQPQRPIFVGLSIGGLFATRAYLQGTPADGLILINTLREDSPRLRWINDAVTRCAQVGGLRLMRDLFLPHLFGQAWLQANRSNFLQDGDYQPLSADDNDARLLAAGATADWDLDYEKLSLPVTIISGRQDHVFYDEAVVQRLTQRIPNAQAILKNDIGHMIPIEDPDAVVAACLDMAARID